MYYSIGDTGPGGGRIFYAASSGFDVEGYMNGARSFAGYKAHYLEVALTNVYLESNPSESPTWSGSIGVRNLIPSITTWGSAPSATQLADSIGKGRRDTQIIIAFYADFANDPSESADQAANYAANYRAPAPNNTIEDWFLPSLGELNLLYQSTSAVSGMPTTGNFWSSSQYNNNYAWRQSFADGTQDSSSKYANHMSRPIRAF